MNPASWRSCELDGQAVERLHLHVVAELGDRVADHGHPLLDGEERRLLRVVQDADHQPIEERRGAAGDVEVRHWSSGRTSRGRPRRGSWSSSRKVSVGLAEAPLSPRAQARRLRDRRSPEVLDHHRRAGRQRATSRSSGARIARSSYGGSSTPGRTDRPRRAEARKRARPWPRTDGRSARPARSQVLADGRQRRAALLHEGGSVPLRVTAPRSPPRRCPHTGRARARRSPARPGCRRASP